MYIYVCVCINKYYANNLLKINKLLSNGLLIYKTMWTNNLTPKVNIYNTSNFDPWVVVRKGIQWSLWWHWFQPVPTVGSKLGFLRPSRVKIRVSNLFKVDENFRVAQVWCRNMKTLLLGWFWPILTFAQPWVD